MIMFNDDDDDNDNINNDGKLTPCWYQLPCSPQNWILELQKIKYIQHFYLLHPILLYIILILFSRTSLHVRIN